MSNNQKLAAYFVHNFVKIYDDRHDSYLSIFITQYLMMQLFWFVADP